MQANSVELYDLSFRDFPDRWQPAVMDQLAGIQQSGCYRSVLYKAPADADETLAAGAYQRMQLQLMAGSWIVAVSHNPLSTPPASGFLWQVTDLGLGHVWFSRPTSNFFALPLWILPAPYPVVKPASFLVEFWNTSSASLRCKMVFRVAEPHSVSND